MPHLPEFKKCCAIYYIYRLKDKLYLRIEAFETNYLSTKKSRIDMQLMLRIFRFCNPQRKRIKTFLKNKYGRYNLNDLNANFA